jgi:opacity protein-like surface antigen
MPGARSWRGFLVGGGLLALGTAPSPVGAAPERGLSRGMLELSTAASFASTKESGDDESLTLLNVPVRVGYFVTRSLSFEGELGFSHLQFDDQEDSSTGILASALALYHFRPASRTTPFLLAGAGVGNSFEYFGLLYDADKTIKAVHVGAGIKTLLGRRAAFRAEYRFTHSWGTKETRFDSMTFKDEDRIDTHRLFVGISVFFP